LGCRQYLGYIDRRSTEKFRYGVGIRKDNNVILDQIRKITEDENIPVYGLGPTSVMANEKPGHRPEDLLPGAQSLICFGLPVPREVYHMPTYGVETVWRSQNLYYRRLDTLSIRFAVLLEERGERAVPIFGCMPLGLNEKRVIVGYLNQIRMGEVTGIGVIGKNGLLINSCFGSRLMLGGVLTTAVLPEMRYPELDEPGCPPDCQICVDACPVDAIMQDRKQVKIMRCLGYTARTSLMLRPKFLFLRAFNPQAAARYMSLTAFDEHTFHVCSKCVAQCPYGGERRKDTTKWRGLA
jgi:epoxyqueuosine reductase QueG